MLLEGKRILITGGTGGIGIHVCALLTAEGASLTAIGRTGSLTAGVRHINANLASESGLAHACDSAAELQPDILVNLAGLQHFGRFEDESPEHLRQSLAVNLLTPIALSKAVLPGMRQARSGQIVNIGSIMGSIGCANFVTYSSAKAGLRTFSEALRREVAESGITVTYIAPRAVAAGMTDAAVLSYAKAANMAIDDPVLIAGRIVRAIKGRAKEVYIGLPERLFVGINAVLPRVVDAALAGTTRKAARHVSPRPLPNT
jgi:short-subunit dehydrogenase